MQNDRERIDSIPGSAWRAIEKARAKSNFVFAVLFASLGALMLVVASSRAEMIFAVSAFSVGAIWVARSARALRRAYATFSVDRKGPSQ